MNRQIAALWSTVGQPKAEVMAQRVRDIAPDCHVEVFRMFYLPQNADEVDLAQYDYVADCIDTVTAKLELVSRCTALQVRIISASPRPRAVPWPAPCARSCADGASAT